MKLGLILTTLINRERLFWGLEKIDYDYKLENHLRQFNGSFLYQSGPLNLTWTIEGHNRFCDLNGCHIKPLEYNYMFRDTFKDSVPRIIRMRIRQNHICKKTVFADGDKCSWFYAYGQVLLQNFTKFACCEYNYQGRYVPKELIDKQKKSFWCYFNTKVYYLG